MASDSEVSGVDVTTTAVHDTPFEVPQEHEHSMQVDDLAGVDIPSDIQENHEGRDIQGYLGILESVANDRDLQFIGCGSSRMARMLTLRF